jgi:hypothetical protein
MSYTFFFYADTYIYLSAEAVPDFRPDTYNLYVPFFFLSYTFVLNADTYIYLSAEAVPDFRPD